MDKSTKEIWKDINGLEGGYQISNFGRIKSLPRLVLCKGLKSTRLTKENFVRPQVRKGKYLKVKLTFNGKLEQPTIHRLVANHFIPNPENKPQVNHIDGNQSNNHIDNLEWVTGKENMHHWMYRQGRVKTGERHSNSKLTNDDVLKIREEYSTLKTPTRQLAKKYNVVQGTIMWVLKRSTWNHI